MKKILSVLLAVFLTFSLVACGGGSGKGTVKSDVKLLDTSEELICYLFAPENYEFDDLSAEGGYNAGTLHKLATADGEYEIDAGFIANSTSTLYDLFVNGKLTATNYNGTEIGADEEYKLEVKEELDFTVADNKVYYLERTINGEYFTNYVVFPHTDKNGEAGLYGVELWSNDSDFYTKENTVKLFKEVYGVGRTRSEYYFSFASSEEDTYGKLESVNIVYGMDEHYITVYKPENGTIELDEDEVYDGLDYVWISSDDYTWNVDVFGAVSFADGTPSHGFVDYYYNGTISPDDEDYAYFDADVRYLDIDYGGLPVAVIEYTYAETGYEDQEETEYFVGVEFVDTFGGEYYGDGLIGFKYYMYEEAPTDEFLASLFGEIFGDEPSAVILPDENEWEDDVYGEGFDTDLIVGEWLYEEGGIQQIMYFDEYDYSTFTFDGVETELTYSFSDDGYLYLDFGYGSGAGYNVEFDGSDTMILEDEYGRVSVFERI